MFHLKKKLIANKKKSIRISLKAKQSRFITHVYITSFFIKLLNNIYIYTVLEEREKKRRIYQLHNNTTNR